MNLPTVTIVGRPNVGKSSLLNCLARRRIAIVDPTSGVTRDRVSSLIETEKAAFELIDTGGVGATDPDDLDAEIGAQIRIALERADLILFTVDAKEGVLPMDKRIALMLRPLEKPIILVVNKVESRTDQATVPSFYEFGLGDPSAISAIEGTGRTDLLDRIAAELPEIPETQEMPKAMKIAIVGRQNVGKSSLINRLAQEDRVIVSERPGTTRDSIDVVFELDGRPFVAIDTAGIKRKTKAKHSVEFYSYCRSERAVRCCDVALFLIDAAAEIGQMDKRIAGYIEEQLKPCVIVVNKWDLAQGIQPNQYVEYIEDRLAGMAYAPISFISAKTGENVPETIQLAERLFKQAHTRASTPDVNKAIGTAMQKRTPRKGNVMGKAYYGAQVAVAPPTIVLFVNTPSAFTRRYTRFLANHFRKELSFPEVPVQIYYRERRRGDKRPTDQG
ncbi:MAG: ribosome biogenesis GTPase Der [Planctomycetes bacterium]|nr:ribosome biogenesis GTPase Der [Planctomycetota bacterium]